MAIKKASRIRGGTRKKKVQKRRPVQIFTRVVTSGAGQLIRHRGLTQLVIYTGPEDVEDPAIKNALAKLASGGNCPTGGHCKTVWVGNTISCENLDCQEPCVCHVWGAPAGEDLKDLGKHRIDDAKEGWLYQCYCTDVVQA